jgi:anaerobic magnesium-protoporphyrin IX monomethyl ester cyclase
MFSLKTFSFLPPLIKSSYLAYSNYRISTNKVRFLHGVNIHSYDDLRICFVHTPMSSVTISGRDKFWFNFDMRYYAVHPGLKLANASIWELPHWMTWLGGVLKAKNFNNIKALSLYTAINLNEGINKNFIEKELDSNPADIYLYSPMTPNLHYAYDIAALVKARYPESINVFGGIIATPLHKQVALHPAVDYVVRDRGEFALPQLLKAISTSSDLANVKNLTYKDSSGQLHSNAELYPYIEPKDIPFPYYDLFPKSTGDKLRYIRQNYALGCPFRCSFCTIQTIGRKPGYFPIERVLKEIKAYRSHYGEQHNIYFGDETFTLDTKRTLEICEALQKEGNITYDIQTRLMSLTNKNLLSALRDSGCKWVEVGIESVVQKSMLIHKQNTNLEKLKDILKLLRDHDLPVCSFIINGLPEQTIDEMRRSIDNVCNLLDENLLHASYFFGLVPYPGSSMYQNPEKYGMKIKHHDYKYYNEDLESVYDTAYNTSEEIYKVFLEGVIKIGQAMSAKPYLGNELSEDIQNNLGKSMAHV